MSPPHDARAAAPAADLDGLKPHWTLESAYVRLGSVPGARLLILQQTGLRIEIADLQAAWQPVEQAVAVLDRAAHSLLIDVRAVAGRNDDAFERALAPYRVRLASGWRRCAVVVKTASGKLQIQRFSREDKTNLQVFDNVREAAGWLRRGKMD